MDYSTFKLNNFFIKCNSTYPELKYPLTQQLREKYDITDEMLENVAVTFSMVDAATGLYRIANVAGNLVVVNDGKKQPDEEKYTLTYRFKLPQTSKSGRFYGEFTIDFLDSEAGCGKMKLPTQDQIRILISDSITKTTVV